MLASFRSRLVLSNLLIVLIGLLIVVLVFTQLLTRLSTEQKTSELHGQAQALAREVHLVYTKHGSLQDLERQVDTASRFLQERIVIVSPAGRVIVDSYPTTRFYNAVLPNARTVASLRCSNLICFRQTVQGTHGHLNGGQVLIVARPADIRPSAGTLIPLIIVAIATALAVWLLIGVYSTYSVFRPLLRITRATERMAQGDYSARVGARGQGEIGQLAGSFDIMAQQVQESHQILRDFLGNVSHDLRTPLTMIAGFSQALLDGTARPEEVEESAGVIHQEALKMQRLVDDLLQLTRLESGLYTLDRHPVEVRPFVQSVIDRAVRAHEGGPPVDNAVPAGVPPMDVDPDRLERALRNLVDNALAYTPPHGRVMVTAGAIGSQWVQVNVADTGVGIPPEDLPRIFERFYRSDKSRLRAQGHSGLGLAIVREIVEAHGGSVGVESEPGRGSTFSFTVPRAHGSASPAGVPRGVEVAS